MEMKRYSNAYSGTIKQSIGKGQTLQTPVGKDSSDWSGGKNKEIPAKMKMGGSMTNLSDTLGKDAQK